MSQPKQPPMTEDGAFRGHYIGAVPTKTTKQDAVESAVKLLLVKLQKMQASCPSLWSACLVHTLSFDETLF
jgi:hypothetical protein